MDARGFRPVRPDLQCCGGSPAGGVRGYEAFDEGAVLEGLKMWLCETWDVDAGEANAAIEAWKKKLAPWPGFADQVKRGAAAPDLDAPVQWGRWLKKRVPVPLQVTPRWRAQGRTLPNLTVPSERGHDLLGHPFA